MHSEKGIEDLVLKNTTIEALERFADLLTWPSHLVQKYPDPKADAANAVGDYFRWAKGNWGIADFLAQCNEDEIPQWMRDTCIRIGELSQPTTDNAAETDGTGENKTIAESGKQDPPDDGSPGGV